MTKVYIRLTSVCENIDTFANKCKSADFCFLDQNVFNKHESCMFDGLIDKFNEWLISNDQNKWRIDDVMEIDRCLTESTTINPSIIDS